MIRGKAELKFNQRQLEKDKTLIDYSVPEWIKKEATKNHSLGNYHYKFRK